MFIHLGNDVLIPTKGIVGMFDLGLRDSCEATDEFLVLAEVEGRMEDVAQSIPKSFVFADDGVYLSPISVSTLKRRAERTPE